MSEGSVWDGSYPSARYPIVYRVVGWIRILSIVAALLLGGLFGGTAFQPVRYGAPLNPVWVSADLGITLLLAYFVWWAFSAKVVLREDAIEEVKPLFLRTLRAADIKGWRYLSKGANLQLALKSGSSITLSIESYGFDSCFKEWIAKLPDLRKIEDEEEQQRVRNDVSLGATEAERLANHARRKRTFDRLYLCLMMAAMALFFAGLLSTDALKVVFLFAAALPWCCLVVDYLYKDQIARAAQGNSGLYIGIPMLMPVFVLFILATSRANLVDASALYMRAIAVGLPLALAACALIVVLPASALQKGIGFVAFALFAWVYGGSVLALGNRVLDQASPQVFHTRVLGKHLVRGRGGPTHYLELAGWGPEPGGTNLEVDSDRYYSAERGDRVCMGVYPGKFGYPWEHSVACP